MKKMMIAAALIALAVPAVGAENKPAAPSAVTSGANHSILEVINIGQALQQMGDFHNGRGDLVKVDFKFDGTTILSFAADIRAANDAQRAYGEGYSKFEAQELGVVKDMKPDELARRKSEIANSDAAKRMLDKPAGALLARIKESELCMKDPPVAPCKVTNNIPPALLSAILPIVDLGK